jgi:outer membrane murein-binding lipoprotein Lpp
VCSSAGDEIDRIAAAIDQLATDVRDAEGGARQQELNARVAALWQMVSDLDPELARRAQRYTGPADGGPSA